MRRILYRTAPPPHDRDRSAMTTLHGLTNCDTVKKARAWLDDQRRRLPLRRFQARAADAGAARALVPAAGHAALVNRRGTTWRSLPARDAGRGGRRARRHRRDAGGAVADQSPGAGARRRGRRRLRRRRLRRALRLIDNARYHRCSPHPSCSHSTGTAVGLARVPRPAVGKRPPRRRLPGSLSMQMLVTILAIAFCGGIGGFAGWALATALGLVGRRRGDHRGDLRHGHRHRRCGSR